MQVRTSEDFFQYLNFGGNLDLEKDSLSKCSLTNTLLYHFGFNHRNFSFQFVLQKAKTKGSKSSKPKEMVTPALYKSLTKQGYKIVGSHSGVKICRWTKAMLRGRGGCYKVRVNQCLTIIET